MNYHRYLPIDVVNGPGTRCTLFLSGCEHHCRNCYNASTWSPHSGHPYTAELQEQILQDLSDTRIPRRGLSLSGGDPLHPANCAGVLQLVQVVKQYCPGKDLWLWTGYTLETLNEAQQLILPYVDCLIDGPFVQEQADPRLPFRGSANQRILHATDFASYGSTA